MLNSIKFTTIYGDEQELRHPICFDSCPRGYMDAIGEVISNGIMMDDGLRYVIRALKKYRHALAYNAKVIKAVRRNVSVMPFYVDTVYYSPANIREAQNAIQTVYNSHTRISNRFDKLIKDYQNRERIRKYYEHGYETRREYEIEQFFMGSYE